VLQPTAEIPRPSDVRRDLPAAFDEVFERALAKDRSSARRASSWFRRALWRQERQIEPVRIWWRRRRRFSQRPELALSRNFRAPRWSAWPTVARRSKPSIAAAASVVVLDLQMPEMDGMAVTALLRARRSERHAIIVLSASVGPRVANARVRWALTV